MAGPIGQPDCPAGAGRPVPRRLLRPVRPVAKNTPQLATSRAIFVLSSSSSPADGGLRACRGSAAAVGGGGGGGPAAEGLADRPRALRLPDPEFSVGNIYRRAGAPSPADPRPLIVHAANMDCQQVHGPNHRDGPAPAADAPCCPLCPPI